MINKNWINGFKASNKKQRYEVTIRLGTFTLFELIAERDYFRFMIFNVGFVLS